MRSNQPSPHDHSLRVSQPSRFKSTFENRSFARGNTLPAARSNSHGLMRLSRLMSSRLNSASPMFHSLRAIHPSRLRSRLANPYDGPPWESNRMPGRRPPRARPHLVARQLAVAVPVGIAKRTLAAAPFIPSDFPVVIAIHSLKPDLRLCLRGTRQTGDDGRQTNLQWDFHDTH